MVAVTHDVDEAHAQLREALLLAEPQGFYRTILQQGPAMPGLLQSLPADGSLVPYVGDLVAMGHGMSSPYSPAGPGRGSANYGRRHVSCTLPGQTLPSLNS